jgi:hypothetical protein
LLFDRRFHEICLGVAAFEQAIHPFAHPEALHGADLVGNFLEVPRCHGITDRAHFLAAIPVHCGTAIEDQRNKSALRVGGQLVRAGESFFGAIAVERQRPVLEDLLRVCPLNFDIAELGCALVRGLAGNSDGGFEPLDFVAAQKRTPVFLKLFRSGEPEVVTDADRDPGTFAGPFSRLIQAFCFENQGERVFRNLEGHGRVLTGWSPLDQ